MDFDPASHSIAERYAMLIGLIVPRPIALVGTSAPDGSSVNLAPFSFFAGCGSNPMSLLFCPGNTREGGEKDSLRNAKPKSEGGQGEFTVSLCTTEILTRAVACSEGLPYGSDEFRLSGLTARPSSVIAPPGVAESPATFECRTLQVVRLAPGVTGGGNIVIGEVVHLRVDDAVLDSRGEIDAAKLSAIGRLGGSDFCSTRERGVVPMGIAALTWRNPFAIEGLSDTV